MSPCISLLADLPVDGKFDFQIVGIVNLICGDNPGATRRETVEPLAGQPIEETIHFAFGSVLDSGVQASFGNVIKDGVAKNMVVGTFGLNVSSALADDNRQFCFPSDSMCY